MRKYIYIFILIISSNLHAQSGIESDELYLKYEQEYLKFSTSGYDVEYELASKNLYSKFNNYKERNKFNKAKDKEGWLSKNYKKTEFNSALEATTSYNKLIHSKEVMDKVSNNIQGIRNELLKKYDVNLIWTTLQTRIKNIE